MPKARYFMRSAIAMALICAMCGCNNKALPEEDNSNDGGAFFDVTVTPEVTDDTEVSLNNPSIPEQSEDIEIKANAILGEFSTNFASSSPSRKQNIRNAAKKLHKVVINPQEEFSACKYLMPFTVENGYKPAGTFVDGKVVNSIGGGVCQVSSTLYNAVLEAELTVIERHAHSMTVSYVEIGHDAAIAEDLKDFRFRNSMDTPIALEAITTDDCRLIFRIRGIEKRNIEHRIITFETKVLEELEPGSPVVEYDKTQEKGYVKVTQSAKVGYRAELYKVIFENGTEERVKINYSEYLSTPQYMIVGAKE